MESLTLHTVDSDQPDVANSVADRTENPSRAVDGHVPLVLLHGLFGSADNWRSRAHEYAKYGRVLALDLRNHGNSPHTAEMDYYRMADDVMQTLAQHGVHEFNLLGHSMGGKVAMLLATLCPTQVKHLIIVDIAPRAYPPHHKPLIDAMRRIPIVTLQRRSEAEAYLQEVEAEPAIRWFLLKSLIQQQSGFRWQFNLESIARRYDEIAASLDLANPFRGNTLFIKGALSDYLSESDATGIADFFPNASLKIIDSSGHWPHAEKPAVFDHVVSRFFDFQATTP